MENVNNMTEVETGAHSHRYKGYSGTKSKLNLIADPVVARIVGHEFRDGIFACRHAKIHDTEIETGKIQYSTDSRLSRFGCTKSILG